MNLIIILITLVTQSLTLVIRLLPEIDPAKIPADLRDGFYAEIHQAGTTLELFRARAAQVPQAEQPASANPISTQPKTA